MGECEITVGIDARTLVFGGSSVRGIGVYVYEQVRHVALLKPHWRFVLYLEAETANQTIKKLLTIPNVGIAFYDHFSPSDVDLFYFPDVMSLVPGCDSPFRVVQGCPTSVLFYDLIPLTKHSYHYDLWPETWQVGYSTRLRQLRNSKARILAISECTKQDLINLAAIEAERISVIYAGLSREHTDNPTQQQIEGVLQKYKISRPYFLTVGAVENHKNFISAANAIIQLNEQRYRDNKSPLVTLAVVGSLAEDPDKEQYKREVEKKGLGYFVFTDYIERSELDCLYAGAAGLLFVSEYEGFGMPVLEAMSFGCPVICSAVSALPEVGGDAVLYVEPKDIAQIVTRMNQLLNDDSIRSECIRKQEAQRAKFSWDIVAERTVEQWLDQLKG